jgi:hypothetical protein
MTQQKQSANKQRQSVNVLDGKEGLPLPHLSWSWSSTMNQVQIQATIDSIVTHLLLFGRPIHEFFSKIWFSNNQFSRRVGVFGFYEKQHANRNEQQQTIFLWHRIADRGRSRCHLAVEMTISWAGECPNSKTRIVISLIASKINWKHLCTVYTKLFK